MINLDDILDMTDEGFQHWWTPENYENLKKQTQLQGYTEFMRFWFDFHKRYGALIGAGFTKH